MIRLKLRIAIVSLSLAIYFARTFSKNISSKFLTSFQNFEVVEKILKLNKYNPQFISSELVVYVPGGGVPDFILQGPTTTGGIISVRYCHQEHVNSDSKTVKITALFLCNSNDTVLLDSTISLQVSQY